MSPPWEPLTISIGATRAAMPHPGVASPSRSQDARWTDQRERAPKWAYLWHGHRNLLMLPLLLALALALAPALTRAPLCLADFELNSRGVLEQQEAQALEEGDRMAYGEVQPEAMDYNSKCARQWSRTHIKAFAKCNRTDRDRWYPGYERGNITELPFLVTLTVLKEDRMRPALKGLTNCTGFAMDGDLVLTHAHCVGPRTETEVTTRIWVYQPLVPGQVAPIEAKRVCWSYKLWYPGAPRAPYDLAVVKLASKLGQEGDPKRAPFQPVCVSRHGGTGSRGESGRGKACTLVQLCQSYTQAVPAESPFTNTTHWFRAHAVELMDDGDKCRRELTANINGETNEVGPRAMSCFVSLDQQHKLEPMCPIEFGRLVFCFRPGCPKWNARDKISEWPQPYLAGIGPMDFHAGEPPLYRPLENPARPNASITSVADMTTLHEQLKDLLVDAQVHLDGGSVRTICRQLVTSTTGPLTAFESTAPSGYVHGARNSNAGSRHISADWLPLPVGPELWPDKWPQSEIDAFDPLKCHSPPDELMRDNHNYTWDLPKRWREGDRQARLPFLLHLAMRKRKLDWWASYSPKHYLHEHTCDAWLISHDTALTHAECVKPEYVFDRVEDITVGFTKPTDLGGANVTQEEPNELVWPKGRHANKVCWPREALPVAWDRPLELAVVRFAPSISYTPNILQPACLDPDNLQQLQAARHSQGSPHTPYTNCTLMATCKPMGQQMKPRMVSISAERRQQVWDERDARQVYDKSWIRDRYNSSHLRTYETNLKTTDQLCGQGESDRWRTIICKASCSRAAKPSGKCNYLAALTLGPILHKLDGGIYDWERRKFEAWPRDPDWRTVTVALDLAQARRQLMELLLASRADNEGTRDVSCQLMPAPKLPEPGSSVIGRGGRGPGPWRRRRRGRGRRRPLRLVPVADF